MEYKMVIQSMYRKKSEIAAKPQLTSLVDILTVLIIFLIHSFSAEGSQVNPVNDINLPYSTNKNNAKSMSSIEINHKTIRINGEYLISVSAIQNSDSMMITELYTKLKSDPLIVNKSTKEIMIQADKTIEFEIVKKIMYTCSKAGFPEFTILVVNEE
jgi:biopolymer transport protein ExbD